MREEYFEALETLEALYFITQNLEGEALKGITDMRAGFDRLEDEARAGAFEAIRKDIVFFRERYGAIASDEEYRNLLREARGRVGYAYLSKLNIDRHWFQHYEKVFPRWPHVPLHGFVVFDGQTNRSLRQIFTLEDALFGDALFFLKRARRLQKGISDFRKRDPKEHRALLAYSRAAINATFHFLEAYLSGLAYDCFMQFHNDLCIEDHDLLAEWNTNKNRIQYVRFENKLFAYPHVVARVHGRELNVSGLDAARKLAEEGKQIRDALTHPSPYVNPKSGEHRKIFWVTGVGLEAAKQLFNAAKEYALAVEKGVGRDPEKTIPWIFEEEP